MRRVFLGLVGAVAFVLAFDAQAAQTWTEGRHYARLTPVQRTTAPAGKVEVREVFSYGCPACNQFQPAIEQRAISGANDQKAILDLQARIAAEQGMLQNALS